MAVKSNKRIINCAVTGAVNLPSMSQYLPINPEDIAQNAIDAAAAGAAVVHLHVRDPKNGSPSADLGLMRQVVEMIRDKNKDVILCLTTGAGVGHTSAQRVAVVPEFKPELASCNCGTINWGLFAMKSTIKEFKTDWEEQWLDNTSGFTFQNDFASMERMLTIMQDNGTKPELEVYDIGHLYNIAYMIQTGVLKLPVEIQFITGILGGIGSTPYDLMNLHTTADRLIGKENYVWSVVGAGRAEYPIATMSLFLGGHCRIGLEDNLYLSKGVLAQNNAVMVEKMVGIMKKFDFEPATPNEAREILSLPLK